MTPEQAIKILQQVFITRQGLSPDDCVLASKAWQTILAIVTESAKKESK